MGICGLEKADRIRIQCAFERRIILMEKLQNDTLQKFLERLAEDLKSENEEREYENLSEGNKYQILNIPFLISSLWEAFRAEHNTYSDFSSCL